MEEPLTPDHIFIRKLTDIVLENLADENFGVKELAHESGMSLYRLSRRLNSSNKKTINQFIREIRLQKALEMLQNGAFTVSEVSFKTGFGSPNYFNKCFHEYFGYSPGKAIKGKTNDKDLSGLKRGVIDNQQGNNTWKNHKLTLPGIMLIVIVIVISVFFLYKKLHKSEWSDGLVSKEGRISLAVMPFRNLTNDTTWNIWQEGIQTSIVSFLANSEALTVRGSVNELLQSKGFSDYASLTPSVENIIANKLGADIFISGSIIQSDTSIRINAQLFNSNHGEAIRSFEIEGPASGEKIFQLVDTLRHQVNDFLIVTKLKKQDPNSGYYFFDPISSPEAYSYMVLAKKAERISDFPNAIDLYKQVIKIDSSIYDAYWCIAIAFGSQGDWVHCKSWLQMYYNKYDKLNVYNKIYADYLYAIVFKTPHEAIRYVEQMINLNDKAPYNFVNLGDEYNKLLQYDKAIPEYERALEIYKEWGIRTSYVVNYTELGRAYHNSGQYRKERKLYKKAEKDFPENPSLMASQAVLSLAEGDTAEANRYISKSILGWKQQSWAEAKILNTIAIIYSQGNYPDKAEEYYRKALSREPENTMWMNSLGFFLIDKDRNIEEGLGLIEEALILKPDDYSLLDTKGWALYKKGKNQDALELMQRSWVLRLKYSRYDHASYLRLAEVKKTAAGQN